MYFFYSLVALIPIMMIWSLFLLRKWSLIYRYAAINVLVFIIYFYLILFSPLHFFAQDQLGLKKIFLFLYIIFIHAAGSFIFAVYRHYKSTPHGNR